MTLLPSSSQVNTYGSLAILEQLSIVTQIAFLAESHERQDMTLQKMLPETLVPVLDHISYYTFETPESSTYMRRSTRCRAAYG